MCCAGSSPAKQSPREDSTPADGANDCRIVFHGAGPAGPGWTNFLLVDAARRAGAAVFPPSAALILPLLFSRLWGKPKSVSLFGYSRGAISAVRLSRFLAKEKILVSLLYLIDPIVLWGTMLPLPPAVEKTFCCFQRNGARLRLLVGHFGKGARCQEGREPKQLLEEEAVCFPDGRPIQHEDMVKYALEHARFRLGEALGLDPGTGGSRAVMGPPLSAGGIEQVPQLVSEGIQRPESPGQHSAREDQEPPCRPDRVDGLGAIGQESA